MAEYGSMLTVSLLAAILFLGGWHGPIPITSMLPLSFEDGFWNGIAGNFLGLGNLLLKGFLGVTIMMWIRWTLPRLRIDQVMTTCLKYCTPIAAVMFLLVTLTQVVLPGRTFFWLLPASDQTVDLREPWNTSTAPQTVDREVQPEALVNKLVARTEQAGN